MLSETVALALHQERVRQFTDPRQLALRAQVRTLRETQVAAQPTPARRRLAQMRSALSLS